METFWVILVVTVAAGTALRSVVAAVKEQNMKLALLDVPRPNNGPDQPK